jgi:hypothetical protein
VEAASATVVSYPRLLSQRPEQSLARQGAPARKTQAAVSWKAGAPRAIEEVDLDGPREDEVLVEVEVTGICHTDGYTPSGADPEGLFPILGHEGPAW